MNASRPLAGRFVASAVAAVLYGALALAGVVSSKRIEIGGTSLPPAAAALLATMFFSVAAFFLAAFRLPRLEAKATIAGVGLFAALSAVFVLRLAVPYRLVLLGRLWPPLATDAEALVCLTIFAVHWNAWLQTRREGE